MVDKRYYVHPHALVESEHIGAGTRIWAFSHVLNGAIIGSNCNIGDHCFIEGKVKIGGNVVIKNGVSIWEGVTIEDQVFVGPNAVFTNLLVPRAKVYPEKWETTLVREGASIGANATIICGVTVGRFALIGAGSVVTRDVADFALVLGNPGRLAGWVCKCGERLLFNDEAVSRASCACGLVYLKDNSGVKELSESVSEK